MRRSRAARSLKNLIFSDFPRKVDDDEEDFRELVGETEKLSCLAHHDYQSNHALITVIWSSVGGTPCSLHALAKSGVEDDYPTAEEALSDSIQKYAIYSTHSNDGGNPYPTSNSPNPYPTVHTRHRHNKKSGE